MKLRDWRGRFHRHQWRLSRVTNETLAISRQEHFSCSGCSKVKDGELTRAEKMWTLKELREKVTEWEAGIDALAPGFDKLAMFLTWLEAEEEQA